MIIQEPRSIPVSWADETFPGRYEITNMATGELMRISKRLHDRINIADMGDYIRGRLYDGGTVIVRITNRFA